MTTVIITFQIAESLIAEIEVAAAEATAGNLNFQDIVIDKVCQLADYTNRIPFSSITVEVQK